MMLDEQNAAEVLRAAGLEPVGPFPGVDRPWRSVHVECGRECSPTLTNIKRGQGGCSTCAKERAAELMRMPEHQARQFMLERGLEPLDPYVNGRAKWRCRHTCGRIVFPALSNVRYKRGVCRYCYSAFPYDGPAIVYLVADSNAVKVGIAAPGGDRVAQHLRLGWREAWRIRTETGDDAYAIEQAILSWWRDELHAPPHYQAEAMPQQGATETVAWEVGQPSRVLAKALELAEQWSTPVQVVASVDADLKPRFPSSNQPVARGVRRYKVKSTDLRLFD